MPFGAAIEGGGVCFRLFAPAAAVVHLELEGSRLEMASAGDGWHRLWTVAAGAGSRYGFFLPDGTRVADPASRYQPEDVQGLSEVIDPRAYAWRDGGWKGRAWEEAVLYELHVGTFTSEGTFRGAIERLEHLERLGVTAIELMCVADFVGNRNWGYDSVLLYAPDSAFGRPEDLKALIDAAHARGMMVILDVVYNHFGPEGNALPRYWPAICSERHCTPWGKALNFDGPGSREVREFILENALYWVEEFHVDGLRVDASHTMLDDGPKHVLRELRERVKAAFVDRMVHLVLEHEDNVAERLMRDAEGRCLGYTAQWNHDITHLLAAVMGKSCEERRVEDGGETERLGKALAKGFVIAAEEKGKVEFECKVPPTAFVGFIQTHDLVGNRIFGDRLHATVGAEAVRAIAAIYLLLPQIPMLFMGEEWRASTPFPYFCDYHGELAEAVRKGRCAQLAKQDPAPSAEELRRAPDPQAEQTLRSAQLRWEEVETGEHAEALGWYTSVLTARREFVVPLLRGLTATCGSYRVVGAGAVEITWTLGGGAVLRLAANLCAEARGGFAGERGREVWREGEVGSDGVLGAWSVVWDVCGAEL